MGLELLATFPSFRLSPVSPVTEGQTCSKAALKDGAGTCGEEQEERTGAASLTTAIREIGSTIV